MNPYEYQLFPRIPIQQLLLSFKEKKLIEGGAISIYGGEIGKPGDNNYPLINILFDKTLNRLNLICGDYTSVIVLNPEGIIINEKIICINTAAEILWETKNVTIEFKNSNNQIYTRVTKGAYNFTIKPHSPAFLMYTW